MEGLRIYCIHKSLKWVWQLICLIHRGQEDNSNEDVRNIKMHTISLELDGPCHLPCHDCNFVSESVVIIFASVGTTTSLMALSFS